MSTRPATVRTRRKISARYDSAQPAASLATHWQWADNKSANAGMTPEVRRELRNRARYERANNSYAAGIVLTLANDLIGTGPRPQVAIENGEKHEKDIEREFRNWSEAVGLTEKLRSMRVARAESGESFAVLTTNERLNSRVKLDLKLVEADQVATPYPVGIVDEEKAVDGIEFDQWGNPETYHVLKHHPGGLSWLHRASDATLIGVASMLHYYRPCRPGQARGVPDLTPALPLFAQLRDYTLAVIETAKQAANIGGVITSDAGEVDADSEYAAEPFDEVTMPYGAMLTLPDGMDITQLKSEQPVTTYGEFKRAILSEIARCLNMPLAIAMGDASEHNYSSGRLDYQTYHRSIAVDRRHFETSILSRIFSAWLNEAVLIEGYLPQLMRSRDVSYSVTWMWDGFEHVDPVKEADAQATRLASRTTSFAREYARDGLDWESEFRQIARERQVMEELGLTVEELTRKPEKKEAEDESKTTT